MPKTILDSCPETSLQNSSICNARPAANKHTSSQGSMDRHNMWAYHPRHPVPDTEAYHRMMSHNKQLLLQIKMVVIFFIGGLIIVVCVGYIVIQCRGRFVRSSFHQARTKREKEKADSRKLLGSTDTLEDLIPPSEKYSLPLKIRKDTEFFV